MVAGREAEAFRGCLGNTERGLSGSRFCLRRRKARPMIWHRPYCAPYLLAGPRLLWGRRSNALGHGWCCRSCPCRPAGSGSVRISPLPGSSALQGLWLRGRTRLPGTCDRQMRRVQGAHGNLRKSSDAQMHLRKCPRDRIEPRVRACKACRATGLKDRAIGVREEVRAALMPPLLAIAWRLR